MAFTSKLASLALMAPGFMMAIVYVDPCAAPGSCTYAYSISATGLDTSVNEPVEDVTTTWNLAFSTLGPEKLNAPDNFLQSFVVTGTPASGWVYDNANSGLTSYGTNGAAKITFDDTNPDGLGISTVTYKFYGTDAFWAQTGGPFNFGATNNPSADSGAFFVFNSPTDGVCTACSVSTTATPNAVTPEPGSLGLLAAVIGMCLLPFRKKLQKQAD